MAEDKGVWVQRAAGLDGFGLWAVCHGGPSALAGGEVGEWQAIAERTMGRSAEVATLSIVAAGYPGARLLKVGDTAQAETAAPTLTFLSGRTTELLGIRDGDDRTYCSPGQASRWTETATLKGLVHCWLVVDPASFREAGLSVPAQAATIANAVPFVRGEFAVGAEEPRPGIGIGIDAAWLGGGESGAQVAAVEMVRELARRTEVDRIVLLSDGGGVPRLVEGIPKISGCSWQSAIANAAPLVDILHRPYQPDMNMDYRRYHAVATCVALTVLDLIAYDNPGYHESVWAWRRYQEAFDENVCLADCVYAISRHVATRLESQFAHRLAGAVRPVPLGTDHLAAYEDETAVDVPEAELQGLAGAPFLLVLGNDFEHKNRDFAVRVFADLRDRGYEGRLVLAGFHLDLGSTFGHELSGAGAHQDAIVRMGSVSSAAKRWLLRHAEVVLYPTSAEGFGLVPFEAAALGTPTAFVAFGPLREMLPGVDACAGWQVRAFADQVTRLRLNPGAQLAQIQAAAGALTWASHGERVLDGYRHLLHEDAPWRTRVRAVPTAATRLRRAAAAYAYRARNKLRRLTGRES